MGDMFATGHSWLNDQMKGHGATLLTYRRGASSIEIAMTIGGPKHPLFSILGSNPGALDMLRENPQNAIRSFVFDAADLDFGAGPVLPAESGDQVIETINGVVCVFNVMPIQGIMAWDYVNDHRGPGARFIVHTQFTGTE